MDTALPIAAFIIFVLPILIIGGAALFPPKPESDPLEHLENWGSQDVDSKLNKAPKA